MQTAREQNAELNSAAKTATRVPRRQYPSVPGNPLRRRAWLLAATSGILQILIFPLPNWTFLAWIALALLLVAVLRARADVAGAPIPASPLQGFVLGFASGLIFYVGSCYWVYHVMTIYGGLPAPVAVAVLLAMCLVLACVHGLFAALLAWFAQPRHLGHCALILAPFLWVVLELLRGLLLGFPWNLLGYVLVDNIALSRVATATGVYGLSFEVMLVNTAFAWALVGKRERRTLLLAGCVLLAGILETGRYFQPPRLPASGTARLVQADIPIQNSPWTPDYFRQTLGELVRLSVPAPAETVPGEPLPDLIVWPESPAPFFDNDPQFRQALSDVARRTQAYVVAGSLGLVHAGDESQLYNSASLVGPQGTELARYDKVHLVPFGEYVPFKSLLGFAHKLTREVGDFVPGAERRPMNLGALKLGTFICYESVFPGEVRQFAGNGGNVFVNISNDGWFGDTAAPAQHLRMAQMRAVENRRWLLRATDTGITVSIDPFGRIVAQARRGVRTAIDVPYGVVQSVTFYSQHGDWFPWACAIISAAALIALALRKPIEQR